MLERRAIGEVDEAALEAFAARRSLSRLQREAPFIGDPRHAHLWADICQTAARDDADSVVLLDGTDLRALCIVRTPTWDREHFGFVLGRIEYLVAADGPAAAAALEWALQRLSAAGARVVTTRLPAEDLIVLSVLQDAGFRYVEHLLTPWRSWQGWQPKHAAATRPTEPEDLPILYDIARATFRTDHFHLDPRFEATAADGVYSRWIESWHADPPTGARSRVIVVDGRVSGFFMYRFVEPEGLPGRTVTDLVLGGMAPDMAGRGQGYRMYCDVMDDAAGHTEYGRVTVVTANVAVVNLYMKLGFRFSTGGEVTLHRWMDAAADRVVE